MTSDAGAVLAPVDPASSGEQPLWRRLVPGIGVSVVVALAARLLHALLPAALAASVGAVIIAVGLGFAVANIVTVPQTWRPGIGFCVSAVLRVGIVLLGARLALDQVLAIGGRAILLIVVLMTVALAVAHGLARLTRTPEKVATLVGIGVSVCGNTAIVATAPAIGASDDDVATAVAVNTLFGMVAVFLYPVIGHALGLDPDVFGLWAGTAVNDTSQVVAVGFAFGAAAGHVATTVKLARNALMGIVIVAMSAMHGGDRRAASGSLLRKSFPLFVVGFLLMAAANSVGLLDAASSALNVDVVNALSRTAQFLLLVALAAVGLATSASGLRRMGWRPFAVGLGAAAATSVVSITAIAGLGFALP